MSARLQLALVLLVSGACFSPTYREGLACSESGTCPGDLQCIEDICVSTSVDQPALDSGPGDPDGAEPTVDASNTPTADATLCLAGTQTIDATGSIVDFVVPPCVTALTIEVFGAEGGSGNSAAVLGGKGARMKGDFAVSEGELLKVLVGMRGLDGVILPVGVVAQQGGGTGGGGSFVATSNGDAMIVAGGGGGATHIHTATTGPYLFPGKDAGIDNAGQSGGGGGPGIGGTGGQGGGTNTNLGYHSGTGGGGFLSPGLASSVGNVELYGSANSPGSSYPQGGAGGVGGSLGRNGGFGGGGASGFTGGGGGGYSGGGSGGLVSGSPMTGGGGGGSFNTGSNPDNSPGVSVGNGQVIMSWLGAP